MVRYNEANRQESANFTHLEMESHCHCENQSTEREKRGVNIWVVRGLKEKRKGRKKEKKDTDSGEVERRKASRALREEKHYYCEYRRALFTGVATLFSLCAKLITRLQVFLSTLAG